MLGRSCDIQYLNAVGVNSLGDIQRHTESTVKVVIFDYTRLVSQEHGAAVSCRAEDL